MKVALLSLSGSGSGDQSDLSGHLLHKLLAEAGVTVVRAETMERDRESISEWLHRVADVLRVDVALTSGGTGLGVLDVTPEATRDAIDFEIPGIAEAIRAVGRSKTPVAMLWRGVAGVRGQTLIVNLSGSPKLVTEQWAVIEPALAAAVEFIHRSDAESMSVSGSPPRKEARGVDESGTLLGPSNILFDGDGEE